MMSSPFFTERFGIASVAPSIVLLSVKGLTFSPVSSWLLLSALALFLVVLVARFYVREDARIDKGRRRLLLGLRMAAFLCVILALLQPTLSFKSKENRRPRVFVLVDNSASMSLPFDLAAREDSSRSREEVAREVARNLIRQLPRRFDNRIYSFSDSLRALSNQDVLNAGTAAARRPSFPGGSEKSSTGAPGQAGPSSQLGAAFADATGARTALGQALDEISSMAGDTPAAVVVLSDGASTFGPDPTRVAKRISVPVYTVLTAREGSFRDVEITEVLHPVSGYAGTEIPVVTHVKGYGLENLAVPISISEGETVVSRGMLKLAGSAETEVLLSVKPSSPGLHFYKVTVPAVKGEASLANNSTSFELRVLSEKLKVLYLEGDLTWDFEFLRRQLESDPRLETKFALVSAGKTKLPIFGGLVSSVPAGLGRSSVVFVGDGAARYMGADEWRKLEAFVGSGGGLFIAGTDGLKEAPEPVKRLLPARLVRSEAWGPEEYLDCRVTFDGLNHPICDVENDASSNASSWKDISPLLGSHVIDSPKPGASVLLEAGPEGKSFPVVVAGSYGTGRVLFVAASGLWRWGFSLPGMGGSDKLFGGFMTNAIWWLSDTERDKGPDMKPQSWVFENGEEVIFSGKGRVEETTEIGTQEGGTGTPGFADVLANLKLSVSDRNGKVVTPLFARKIGADSSVVDFGLLPPGTYTYRVSVATDTMSSATAGSFLVDSNGPEYRNLSPDSRILNYISEASGGKSFASDQVDVLAREIRTFGDKAIVERQVKLWNHPLLFSLFTAFVAVEWWLRRRYGLP